MSVIELSWTAKKDSTEQTQIRNIICDDYLVVGGDLIYRGQIVPATAVATFKISPNF